MAEWLRRLTRNQMGSSRVGSNPTHSEEKEFKERSLLVKYVDCGWKNKRVKATMPYLLPFTSKES